MPTQEDPLATLCPFLGSDCVEDKCKMWRDGDCLIPAFLSTSIVRNIQELAHDEEEFEEDEFDEEEFEDEEDEVDDEDEEEGGGEGEEDGDDAGKGKKK
jgi:hypothetical protein